MKSGDFAGEIVTTTLVVMITMTAYKLLRDAHMCRKPSFSLCSSKAKGEGRDHSSMYVQYIQPHIRCSPFSVSLHINKYTSILCVCVCVCVCASHPTIMVVITTRSRTSLTLSKLTSRIASPQSPASSPARMMSRPEIKSCVPHTQVFV